MSPRPLEPVPREIVALLASERSIEPEPEAVRRRALLRARAAARWQQGKIRPSAGPPAWLRGIPPVAAAAAICLVITALCAAVVQATRRTAQPAESASPRQPEPASAPLTSANGTRHPSEAASALVESEAKPEAVGSSRPAFREDGYASELRLLEPARQAVSAGNLASALGSIAAHERRFPNGRLAEEREALRVKALRGLGRTDDARRAAAEFRQQFPRSVLSSQMGEAPRATP